MKGVLFFQCPQWRDALLAQPDVLEVTYEQGLYPNDEQWVRVTAPRVWVGTIEIFARFGDHHDLDRQIWRLMLILESLSRMGARIELTLPYVPYSLQNRDVRGGDAVGLSLFLRSLKSFGVEKIRVVDLHSTLGLTGDEPALEHRSFEEVVGNSLRADLGEKLEAVIAPDKGARQKAESYGRYLGLPVYTFTKTRHGAGDISLDDQASDLPEEIKNVLVIDDMINTGSTIIAVIASLRERKKHVWCAVTHGLFAGSAYKKLQETGVEKIYVSDSFESAVSRQPKANRSLCKQVSLTPLFSSL